MKAGFFVQLEKSLGGFTSGLEKVASTFDEGKLATTCTETVSFESWQVHKYKKSHCLWLFLYVMSMWTRKKRVYRPEQSEEDSSVGVA